MRVLSFAPPVRRAWPWRRDCSGDKWVGGIAGNRGIARVCAVGVVAAVAQQDSADCFTDLVSAAQAAAAEVFLKVPRANSTIPVRIPSTTMTMSSSTSVKPCAKAGRRRRIASVWAHA